MEGRKWFLLGERHAGSGDMSMRQGSSEQRVQEARSQWMGQAVSGMLCWGNIMVYCSASYGLVLQTCVPRPQ